MTDEQYENLMSVLRARYPAGGLYEKLWPWELILKPLDMTAATKAILACAASPVAPTPSAIATIARTEQVARENEGPLTAKQVFRFAMGFDVVGSFPRIHAEKKAVSAICRLCAKVIAERDPDSIPALEQWFVKEY